MQVTSVPVTMSIMPWNSLHAGSKDVRSSKNRTPVTNMPVLRVASGSDVQGGRGASAHRCLSYKTRPQVNPRLAHWALATTPNQLTPYTTPCKSSPRTSDKAAGHAPMSSRRKRRSWLVTPAAIISTHT